MSEKLNPKGSAKSKRGRLEVHGGQPLLFIEDPNAGADASEPSAALQEAASQVGATLKAFRDAAKALLSGRYKDLREIAPSHLKEPCDIAVICCSNGIIVRYDLGTEGATKIRSGAMAGTLTELAPKFSDSLVHFPPDQKPYVTEPGGIQLEFAKVNIETGQTQPISTVRLVILASLSFDEAISIPPPPSRPPALLSLTNELSLIASGVVEPADSQSAGNIGRTREFVAKGMIKLQVGWQAFEVYPSFQPEYWKPEFAPLWAENDLLAAVARRQITEAGFAAIDPNVAARNRFKHVLQELARLLDGPEEPAHQYLKQHPEILCPTHIASWSKLRLGKHITDFVFRLPGNEYLLVEIESPLRELFRKDGQQRKEVTHAFNQIIDWRTFIEDNLRAVQEELALVGISSNPESLIVIGRSAALSQNDRRKLVTLQNQIPKLRILTYDDLIQNSKAVAENLFGPLDITGHNVEIYYGPTKTGAV